MKEKFTITGTFYAEDLDDAFRLLAMHFDCLLNDSELDVFEGYPHKVEVKPEDQVAKHERETA